MSSATSTSPAEARESEAGARRRTDPASDKKPDSLQPWQFFVLAALGCATAALFASRGQGVSVVVLLTVLMGAAGLTGVAALRMLMPLVSPDDDRTLMIGQRTRAALEREKALSLRAIKELEFDRAMGKVSDVDFVEMSSRLRARATRLMRQLDAGAGYRERIERDLEQRIGKKIEGAEGAEVGSAKRIEAAEAAEVAEGTRSCASCDTKNDLDAKFCKGCGQKL